MRCAECGHNLDRVAEGAPCTECGEVTPVQLRLLQPLPGRVRLLWQFGWPLLMAWSLGLLALFVANRLDQVAMVLVVLTVVSIVAVGPVNSAWRTFVLMKRLPRRIRSAPFLIVIPRSITIPILVGVATILIFNVLTFGACITVFAFGNVGKW